MNNFENLQEKIGTWDEEHKMFFHVDEYDDEIFYSSRSKARFRNAQNRSAYHNSKNRDERQRLSALYTLIRRNYKILKKLYPESYGVAPIPMTRLTALGYSLVAPTHRVMIKDSTRIIYFTLEFGLEQLENNQKAIIYFKNDNNGNHSTRLL
jgi:hypothetical protein